MKNLMYAAGILVSGLCFSQETSSKVKASFFDGIAVAGYVDDGAFINFTGPNVSLVHKKVKFIMGMLPSLRIKEDHSSGTRNSFITPTLGAGLTTVYKRIALQVPVYYNPKTADQDGKWKIGIGLGYSFR
ncbi:hypothetical protein C1631_013310 [Chryseobacterium phosphatilyticum]|uniref:Outer membrane protein beta-barrel domain-containing protein n=1 Tax=Chryseobacterium phosphatilyticum TaxID=475075 RepID=A0A316X5H1_9FLAO|nr:hypothetical protein [Chryseobacterium phosphatilyticum]PWN69041.1 hypothetical protein C1631_013310 [Chryseobacterium phosphatilyticum]